MDVLFGRTFYPSMDGFIRGSNALQLCAAAAEETSEAAAVVSVTCKPAYSEGFAFCTRTACLCDSFLNPKRSVARDTKWVRGSRRLRADIAKIVGA